MPRAIRLTGAVGMLSHRKISILPCYSIFPTEPHGLRLFSVLNRPPPQYHGHIPLNGTEKFGLAIGSAIGAFLNPRRADLVASLGEVTAGPSIRSLRDTMLADTNGRRILRERPRISSQTMPPSKLRSLPENTVGRVYVRWLDDHRMSPDARDVVKFIDNDECAYVMQRYRESHDLYHAVLGIPPFVEGEIALKALEFVNTGLPMPALSLFAVARLKPVERSRFFSTFLPWALRQGLDSKPLINVYWEEEIATNVDVLLQRLRIERPPDLRTVRRQEKQRRKEQEEQKRTNDEPPQAEGTDIRDTEPAENRTATIP